jgi:hypothetical protein
MYNTPNNNNQQAIRNKPKIPYTRHLVEDDKNHKVSIFRVYHFQSRIALTLLYYLMFVYTTQLLGKILDTVGASGCLEYAGAPPNSFSECLGTQTVGFPASNSNIQHEDRGVLETLHRDIDCR